MFPHPSPTSFGNSFFEFEQVPGACALRYSPNLARKRENGQKSRPFWPWGLQILTKTDEILTVGAPHGASTFLFNRGLPLSHILGVKWCAAPDFCRFIVKGDRVFYVVGRLSRNRPCRPQFSSNPSHFWICDGQRHFLKKVFNKYSQILSFWGTFWAILIRHFYYIRGPQIRGLPML